MKRALFISALLICAVAAFAQDTATVRDGMRAISDRYGVHFVYDASLPVDRPFPGQSFKKKSLPNALKVLFDNTGIEWRRKGKYVLLRAVQTTPQIEVRAITQVDTIAAASITGKIDRDINYTQTGLTKIDGAAFNRAFAVFGSPDVIKTLQTLPGVASGTEMLSKLYVHGGDGSDNLFLLDGVPLYQVCHLGGIFSSFNTDVIDNVDFYKSGFPARYGGRTSSVVDVTTNQGDFSSFRGQASIGLLEGRIQLEGPIIKDRTSFNIALRRSWADAIMYPVCLILNNKRQKENPSNVTDRSMLLYSFTDLNAKITHKISPTSRISANFYLGNDHLGRTEEQARERDATSDIYGNTNTSMKFSWGNTLLSVNWEKDLSPVLNMDVIGFWSASRSTISYAYKEEGHALSFNSYDNCEGVVNHNVLDDIGITANIIWQPAGHIVRFGGSAICHSYRPDYAFYESEKSSGITYSDISQQDTVRAAGIEMSVYVEDEMSLTRRLKANVGFRNTVYAVVGKVWNYFEPRLAIKYQCCDNVAAKVSYARMSQFSHQMAATYLDLPTNCWLPSSASLPPMSSHQFAGGIYSHIAKDLHLNVEGWYKTMDNLVEYYGENSLFPRLNSWESVILSGQGRSYGIEVDFGYETSTLSLNAFYTLSWSERKYEQIYNGWYRDRNDNRHKITLQANWRLNKKWELYAAWNFHSGNRMTLPTQYLRGVYADGEGYKNSFMSQWIYEEPNNVKLPDYHRLDFGANKHGKTKRGNAYVWNISVYNVYCRMNPVFAVAQRQGMSRTHPDFDPGFVAFKGIGTSIVPILPTISYKVYFGK